MAFPQLFRNNIFTCRHDVITQLMPVTIEIKLFASLKKHLPDGGACSYSIEPGTPLSVVLDQLRITKSDAKLIFIDGVKEDASVLLMGGERVGVFPPIGGG